MDAPVKKRIGPTSLYRLQLNAHFTFRDAERTVPYLAELGISHPYLSPILAATRGSTHGYNVIDHTRLNPEVGSAEEFDALHRTLESHGMGIVLDIVPNHMSIDSQNRWWTELLSEGRSSPRARVFDVDWNPLKSELAGKVLLPVLDAPYGRVLESGALSVTYRWDEKRYVVRYYQQEFPISKASVQIFEGLLPEEVERRLNNSSELLHQLLERQHYRLAHWRVSSDEVNYRRFFDNTDLIGIRMEDPQVFSETHAFLVALFKNDRVHGFRIDYPDGLANPGEYFSRLVAETRSDSEDRSFPIYIEKILADREPLPPEWPVTGTTGYEFIDWFNHLLVDGSAGEKLTRFFREFTGFEGSFKDLIYSAKVEVIRDLLASRLNSLAHWLNEISEANWHTRDFTLNAIRNALVSVTASFQVYRTYRTETYIHKVDREYITQAIDAARIRNPLQDPTLFRFIRSILLDEFEPKLKPSAQDAVNQFVLRFQQYTAPVMAKGVEDTAFYRWNRLIALNEVGGAPDHCGRSIAEYHDRILGHIERFPLGLLALTTHDTKRSADVRARILAISEFPDAWTENFRNWAVQNSPGRTEGMPEANTEYFIYQTLLGSWPLSMTHEKISDTEREQYRERIEESVIKAAREAKRSTSWLYPNEAYEAAIRTFIGYLFDPRSPFIDSFLSALPLFLGAGLSNALAQRALQLTSPGVPDLYQGDELGCFTLVDPDNRRPVDFEVRKQFIKEIPSSSDRAISFDAMKFQLIHPLLKFRRENFRFFESSGYAPLSSAGRYSQSVVAFMRVSAERSMLVAVSNHREDGASGPWVRARGVLGGHGRALSDEDRVDQFDHAGNASRNRPIGSSSSLSLVSCRCLDFSVTDFLIHGTD